MVAKIFNMTYLDNIATSQLFSNKPHYITCCQNLVKDARRKRRLQPEADVLNAVEIQENDTKYKIIFTNAMIQYIRHKSALSTSVGRN